MIKKIKSLSVGLKLSLTMIIIYGALALFVYPYFIMIFQKLLQNFQEIVPVLLLAFAVVFMVNYLIKPELIKKHLGRDSGLKGWLFTLLGSIFISGPPYVILPILKQLKAHGMKSSLLAVFLNNRNVQPAYLPVMAYYFGLKFTIIISVYIIIFAILTGAVMGRIMTRDDVAVS